MKEKEERRYSDDEIRRIFEDATKPAGETAEAEGSGEEDAAWRRHAPDGLTIDQLREIAREIDIDPAAIDRAAEKLPSSPVRLASASRSPFTPVLHAESILDRPLTDPGMRTVALEAERVLARRGKVRRSGDITEWHDEENQFFLRIARVGESTRLRVTADQSSDLLKDSISLGLLGIPMLFALVAFDILNLALAAPLVVAATSGMIWLQAVGRSANTRDLLKRVLDDLLEVARLG